MALPTFRSIIYMRLSTLLQYVCLIIIYSTKNYVGCNDGSLTYYRHLYERTSLQLWCSNKTTQRYTAQSHQLDYITIYTATRFTGLNTVINYVRLSDTCARWTNDRRELICSPSLITLLQTYLIASCVLPRPSRSS